MSRLEVAVACTRAHSVSGCPLGAVIPSAPLEHTQHAVQPIHVTGENGAVSTHCLLQVIRGQEVHVVRGDTSKAARLYRGKSNSLRTEGVADGETMPAPCWQVGRLVRG